MSDELIAALAPQTPPAEEGAPKPAGEPSPASPQAPDPIQTALRNAAEAIRAQKQETARMAEIAQQALASSRQTAPAAPEEEDIDPSIAAAVERRIQREVSKIANAYQTDRLEDFEYRSSIERERIASLPMYGELQADIDNYMANVDPRLRSTPGAWREAYRAVLGARMEERLIQHASRSNSVSTSTRTTVLEPSSRGLSAEDKALMSTHGIALSDKDLELFGRNSLTINEYEQWATQQRKA